MVTKSYAEADQHSSDILSRDQRSTLENFSPMMLFSRSSRLKVGPEVLNSRNSARHLSIPKLKNAMKRLEEAGFTVVEVRNGAITVRKIEKERSVPSRPVIKRRSADVIFQVEPEHEHTHVHRYAGFNFAGNLVVDHPENWYHLVFARTGASKKLFELQPFRSPSFDSITLGNLPIEKFEVSPSKTAQAEFERYDYAQSIIGRRVSLRSKKLLALPHSERVALEREIERIYSLADDLTKYTPDQIESVIREQTALLKIDREAV